MSMNIREEKQQNGCRLCARACGVDRAQRAGRCGETVEVYAARAALHLWEEPCISGREGSGAVFFTGCPLGCIFCQNREIALGSASRSHGEPDDERVGRTDRHGVHLTIRELTEVFLRLQAQGANNINLVTPTHYVPQIAEALRLAGEELRIPVVYNTGTYETVETVDKMAKIVDIFLPDLKFCDPGLSARYAAAPDYFAVATAAIARMAEIVGEAQFDGRGMMKRGMIVRHMVLPGHTRDSMAILDYLAETYGDRIYVSIMNQYTPMPGVEKKDPLLGRKVTRREYERVVGHAISLGLSRVFIQEGGTVSESFIPAFDGEGLGR